MAENNTTGKNAHIAWIWTGGTLNLAPDYRSVSIKENIDTAETTAGSDAYKTYLPTIKSASIDYSGLFPAGGTVLVAALAPGNFGTISISAEGATVSPVKNFPAICLGATFDIPYADVVAVNCTFQSTGAWS